MARSATCVVLKYELSGRDGLITGGRLVLPNIAEPAEGVPTRWTFRKIRSDSFSRGQL